MRHPAYHKSIFSVIPTAGASAPKRTTSSEWVTRLLFLILLFMSACTRPQLTSEPNADPQFDWFEYEGRDPIYERVTAGPGEYLNPILAGFYPDPSIVGVGEDFYLVTSSFSYFPGVPIFHSKDLVNWTQIGHVLDRPSQLPLDSLGISRGIFAPTIRHHDGTFYMLSTLVDAGGNFVVTATDPVGPWSDPVFLPFEGIDPDIFFDDDGRAYISNNGAPDYEPLYDGHRALWLQEFDLETKQMVGPRRVIVDGGVDISQKPIWIEAPHIFKIDGTYYLIAAEGGTSTQHSEVVLRSENIFGPYEPYAGNPILTQRHLPDDRPDPITSAGHADFVQLPNGDWWAIFLATRPYEGNYYNTGRETFLLPVRWENGWPTMLSGDATVPYVHAAPDLPAQPPAPVPMSGNFTFREEFEDDTLAPYWMFIRTPRETWHTLDGGTLTLRARPAGLGDLAQPSFVGRRQQHMYATATTAMRYRPAAPGDIAGLTAFQNDDYYYLLAVTLADGQPVVQLEKKAGGAAEIVASAPLDLPADGTVYLKIDADADTYRFSYALQPDAWITLEDAADGKILSTQTAGGFVGALFGLYASTRTP